MVSKVSTVLLLLCPLSMAQVNFGGSNSNSKPASPRPGNNGFSFGNNNNSGRPASSRPSTGAGNNGFSFGGNSGNNNDNNISGNNRPSFGSGGGDGVSIEFGGGSDLSSNVKTLASLLGSRAPPTPDPLTRRKNAGTRRRGSRCTTPAGEAGSCQYILASQCQPVLSVILQQGVTQQVLFYIIQAIRSPCGFEGFDFTLCCADPNLPFQSTETPSPAPTPATPTTTTTSTSPAPAPSQCGVNGLGKIVGGVVARQGAWPWAVILGRQQGFGGGFRVMCR